MRRPKELAEQVVHVRAAPDLCFQVVAAAGRVVEERTDRERVVEYDTEVRGHRVVTKELVRLDPDHRRISYAWLEGPLPFVEETIDVEPLPGGASRLRYRGRFRMRPGLVQCLIGIAFVPRMFARAVREHLAEAKEIAERRAARSKIYPPPTE